MPRLKPLDVVLDEPASLVFTDAAARKVGDLIRAEENPKLMLRVYVQAAAARA